MANTNIITVPLSAVGGTPPYYYDFLPNDPLTSLPANTYSVANSNGVWTLTVDATTIVAGDYVVNLRVTDQNGKGTSSFKLIDVHIADPGSLTILTEDQNFAFQQFPQSVSVPLSVSGNAGSVVWSLLPSVTTVQGVSIDSSANLNFTLTSYGMWTIGVQAKDSVSGALASKVLEFQAVTSSSYQLVDGQVEIDVNVPAQNSGVNNFTLSVKDSVGSVATQTFSYTALSPVSGVGVDDFAFDHYWGSGDTTTVVLPITGELPGFSIGTVSSQQVLPNGLTVSVDTVNSVVSVTGPASVFQNSEISVPIAVMQGNVQVATVTREFTLLAHNGAIGTFTCNTRPYIVNDTVGLNPLKPYFNSPGVMRLSGTTTRVQAGSALPPGLSLDANTGLIYGTVVGLFVGTSVLEYLDTTSTVTGVVTINWNIKQGDFKLSGDTITDGQVQQPFNGSITVLGSTVNLTNAGVYSGRLPTGLSLQVDNSGAAINIVGSPTEAGYFDIWFSVTNANGKIGYLYKRIVVEYAAPLVIVTSFLPTMTTNQAYQVVLQGFGGVSPYTWSLDTSSPALPTGITLSSAGVLSGTPTDAAYNQNVVIRLTDSRFPTVSTTAVLSLAINNTLTITTTALGKIVPGQNYKFVLSASGGTGTYTWSLPSGFTLPSGISFNGTTGTFSGVTNSGTYSQDLTITLRDGVNTTSKAFTLSTTVATGMLIDTTGVGAINRGNPYQGVLRAFNDFTAPVEWQMVTPLPSGLQLQANAANNGITATISGNTQNLLADGSTGYPTLPVEVFATDSLGNPAYATVLLQTTTDLKITTPSIPAATVSGIYNFTLQASGGAPATAGVYQWDISPDSPDTLAGTGLALSSSGVISGSGTSVMSRSIRFRVQDSLNPTNSATALLTVQIIQSTLAVTTPWNGTSNTGGTFNLPNVTAGRSYVNTDSSAVTLKATGGSGTYTWAVVGNTMLPTGLSLSSSGVISGTTSDAGYNKSVTIQVSDGINKVSGTFNLQVVSGLQLQTGIDYIDGTNTNVLGYITKTGSVQSFDSRPNMAFYVVATGVIDPTNIQVSNMGAPFGYVTEIPSTPGVVYIRITDDNGAFPSGQATNSFPITVTDSGVVVTATFTWTVYDHGTLTISASNTSQFPTRILNP